MEDMTRQDKTRQVTGANFKLFIKQEMYLIFIPENGSLLQT